MTNTHQEDADILEAKIATLVDEFEQKHKPIQVNVLTRWRKYDDKYKMTKGGAAQIILHDCSACEGNTPATILVDSYRGDGNIYYTDSEL